MSNNPKAPIALGLGEEFVSPNEPDLIDDILKNVAGQMERTYPPNTITARRAVHPKTHGCVRATFEVNADIPNELRHGVFSRPGRACAAWIRFSSGKPILHPDYDADVHGMAVKLTGVEGDKILGGEKYTQDFVMANHPTFFIRDITRYVAFEKVVSQHTADNLETKLAVAGHLLLHGEIREVLALNAASSHKLVNPFQAQYWSQTPYRLGAGPGPAVKFSAAPRLSEPLLTFAPDVPGRDALTQAMANHLESEDAVFDFMLQLQADPATMPVEDALVEWDAAVSPFVPVATIRIHQGQSFDSRAQMRFAEQLSFNPWHSLPEHRPLGGINRARRAVYLEMSALRNKWNGLKPLEPTGNEPPFAD